MLSVPLGRLRDFSVHAVGFESLGLRESEEAPLGLSVLIKLSAVMAFSVLLFRGCGQEQKSAETRNNVVPETELRSLAQDTPDIIWPQALDGATTRAASFRVSVDATGQVREVLPLHTANERTNDSAVRQIMKWKFKPVVKNGNSVKAESVLSFNLDTRAFGPPSPLSDAQARNLADNIFEPMIPANTAPVGATMSLRIAVDSEGSLIEVIAADGPPELFMPCYEALKKWEFHPLMQDGQPRPYRATIICRAS